MTYTNKENAIEWITGEDMITVTLTNRKYISKVKKLAEKFDSVKIIAENDDGSIYAHLPLKCLKISAPGANRSEEARAATSERAKKMQANRKKKIEEESED